MTGSALPLSVSAAPASASTAWRTSRYVSGASSTAPGSAACSSRAARLATSPVTRVGVDRSPAVTSPVATPIRMRSVLP